MSKQHFELIYRTNVTGLSHSNYPWFANELEAGVDLTLETRPDNSADRQAIAVMLGDEQVGWIPAANAAVKEILFKMLRADVDLRCKVISHDRTRPLQERLYIGIYLRTIE